MGYFPFYIDIKNKNALIVGAGKVAFHKIKKLIPYETRLHIIAERIDKDVYELAEHNGNVTYEQRKFKDDDIEGNTFVVAATSDESLNAHIYRLCSNKGILVNVVDVKDKCDFIFPSVVHQGNLSIGISSSGTSPYMTRIIADKIKEIIPDNIEAILDFLSDVRIMAKEKISDSHCRAEFLSEIAAWCYENNTTADTDMIEKIINKFNK